MTDPSPPTYLQDTVEHLTVLMQHDPAAAEAYQRTLHTLMRARILLGEDDLDVICGAAMITGFKKATEQHQADLSTQIKERLSTIIEDLTAGVTPEAILERLRQQGRP